MYILTDHKFYTRESKLFTYTFKLLWKREVGNVANMVVDTIKTSEVLGIKRAVQDTGRKSQYKFICRLEDSIFFKFRKIVYVYDIPSGKHSTYEGSKQLDLMSGSLLNEFKVKFFENFIKKSLVVS